MKRELLAAFLLLLMVATTPILSQQQPKVEKVGPRIDRLLIKIYENPEAEALALKAGEIDLMDWSLPAEKIEEFKQDPNIQLFVYEEFGMFEIDINHRVWPTSDLHFRRACAYLVDKDRLISEVIKGYAVRIDSPVPSSMGEWYNPNIMIYEYDPEKAAEELELAGIVDTDGDGIRNDPRTGKNMDPIIFYIRADDPYRKTAGEWLAEELEKLGVPVDAKVVERTVCYEQVMVNYEYHLYTGGWLLGPDPDHLYDLYHSSQDVAPEPWSYNYPGFHNETFDMWAEKVKYGSTKEEVLEAAHKAQEVFAEQVATIPLYNFINVVAARKNWVNIVNHVGYGPHEHFTFLQAHPEGQEFGGTLKWGFKSDVESLNPIKAEWVWDWYVLDRIYDYLIRRNPYNPAEWWPWLAESWTVEEWTTPDGQPGLKITFKLCKNVTFHDGVKMTSADVKFTVELLTHANVSRWMPYTSLVEKIEAPDDYTVVFYLNTQSYLALAYVNYPVLPKHIWEKHWDDWMDLKPDETGELIGTGPFKFVEHIPGEYVLLEANGNYFRRHPGKSITLESLTTPGTLKAGETGTVSVAVKDYTGAAVTNATVKAEILKDGAVVSTVTLTHTSGGTYEGTVTAPSEPGDYTVRVTATYTNPTGTYSAETTGAMTVAKKFPMTLALGVVVLIIIVVGVGFVLTRKKKE